MPALAEAKLPSGESTASAQPRLLAGAFRLTGSSTPLYRGPNTASAQLLENGALVVVTDSEKDFLRVITPDGRAGFIPSSASMTSVDISMRCQA
jgi:hypothetical protein